jgi:Fibronectin type III domain
MHLLRLGIPMAILGISSLEAPAATNSSPSASSPQQRAVTFTWNSPPDSSVVSYKIYWGTGSGNYQHVRELKTIPRTKLSLATNIKYYVAVSACNTVGESRLSNEVIVPRQAK